MWNPDIPADLASHPFTEALVQLDDISVDTYQRPLRPERVAQIVRKFDASQARAIQVSQRPDGTLWAIDGQHTAEALKEKGVTVWIGRIHTGLTYEQEAALFVEHNQNTVKPSSAERFNGELQARIDEAVTINDVLVRHGYYIVGSNPHPDGLIPVTSVRGFKRVYRMGGAELLDAVITVATEAWPNPTYQPNQTFHPQLFPGIARLLVHTDVPLDGQRLARVLAAHEPTKLAVSVASGRTGADRIVSGAVYEMYLVGRPETGDARIRTKRRPHMLKSAAAKDDYVTWGGDTGAAAATSAAA